MRKIHFGDFVWTAWLADGPTLPARLARAVVGDIREGVLHPGDRLPGSRTLATTLGVHRNTVLAAMRELEAEGWTRSVSGSGTAVAASLPAHAARHTVAANFPVRACAQLPLGPVRPPPTLLDLGGGIPDTLLFPRDELGRAWRRALRRPGILDYGDPQGTLRLREVLARLLSGMRGIRATPADVQLTRGAQGAVDLLARVLFRPGDRVAVEAFGYRPAWAALRSAGAVLVPIPVDGEGLRVDAIPEDVRAVYLTPHHQYPTTVTLSATRRLALLARARRSAIPILEDDYDHEFHYDGPPVLPLAAEGGNVVYIGTLSKILAPALRLGFIWGPPALMVALPSVRRTIDHCGDAVLESAVAELFEGDEAWRHIRRATRMYRERRDVLVEALHPLPVVAPTGGIALWLPTAHPSWEHRAAARGVGIRGARWFTPDGADGPGGRVVFSAHPPHRLQEAAKLLVAAWPGDHALR